MSEFRGVEVFGRPGRRATPPGHRRASPPSRPRWRLGMFSFGAALFTGGSTAAGILLAMAGKYEASILLAYLATGASIATVLCAGAAVLTGRGRGWATVALVLGILSSPPMLTRLLDWASGLG